MVVGVPGRAVRPSSRPRRHCGADVAFTIRGTPGSTGVSSIDDSVRLNHAAVGPKRSGEFSYEAADGSVAKVSMFGGPWCIWTMLKRIGGSSVTVVVLGGQGSVYFAGWEHGWRGPCSPCGDSAARVRINCDDAYPPHHRGCRMCDRGRVLLFVALFRDRRGHQQDQARRHDHAGEPLVRLVLRHVSGCGRHSREERKVHRLPAESGHTQVRRTVSRRGRHRRRRGSLPQGERHGRQRRQDGRVREAGGFR